jgi:hypothetical protein
MLLNRLFGDNTLAHEDVDQVLQGFHILFGDQVVVHGHSTEVDKAAVHFSVAAKVPEGIGKVIVVKMRITTKHLLYNGLHIGMVVLRKARRFSNPLILDTSKRGQRLGEVGGRCGDRVRWTRCTNVTRNECVLDRSRGRGGKGLLVVNLAHNPTLNSNDVLRCRDLSRASILEPGVGEARRWSAKFQLEQNDAYRPADMVGQCCSLQSGRPLLVSTSWMT